MWLAMVFGFFYIIFGALEVTNRSWVGVLIYIVGYFAVLGGGTMLIGEWAEGKPVSKTQNNNHGGEEM